MLAKELQELINIPSVCWYETEAINYLYNWWASKWIPTQKYEKRGVIFWNPKAPTYYIAHIDEVGGRVSYVDDNIIHIETKWWVTSSMLIGRDIEIITSNGIIDWLISSPNLLSMEEVDLHSLKVSVDPTQRQYIQWWDPIRYKPRYTDLPESIIATWLDNKLGVVIAMELALEFKDNGFLQNNAICLCTEEEDKNQWAIFFMKEFMPRLQIVLDISPMSKEIDNDPLQWLFINKTADYQLDDSYTTRCISAGFEKVETTLNILNRSEAMQYQNITKWTGINLNIPVYNYHLGSYFVYKKAIIHFTQSLKNLIKSLDILE